MHLKLVLSVILALVLMGVLSAAAETLVVGQFSALQPGQNLPPEWEPMTFPQIDRLTAYSLVADQGRTVVRAVSDAAASGLIHRFRAQAETTPWLIWNWKIAHVLEKGDVSRKGGDDYAARLYVAFAFSPEGASVWQRLRHLGARIFTRGEAPGSALNYIWGNRAEQGTVVDSPYVSESKMLVLQSGNLAAGQWRAEKRNIADDYRAAFGFDPPPIIGVAIMTDTDNTGEATTGYFGDILLTDDPGALP